MKKTNNVNLSSTREKQKLTKTFNHPLKSVNLESIESPKSFKSLLKDFKESNNKISSLKNLITNVLTNLRFKEILYVEVSLFRENVFNVEIHEYSNGLLIFMHLEYKDNELYLKFYNQRSSALKRYRGIKRYDKPLKKGELIKIYLDPLYSDWRYHIKVTNKESIKYINKLLRLNNIKLLKDNQCTYMFKDNNIYEYEHCNQFNDFNNLNYFLYKFLDHEKFNRLQYTLSDCMSIIDEIEPFSIRLEETNNSFIDLKVIVIEDKVFYNKVLGYRQPETDSFYGYEEIRDSKWRYNKNLEKTLERIKNILSCKEKQLYKLIENYKEISPSINIEKSLKKIKNSSMLEYKSIIDYIKKHLKK